MTRLEALQLLTVLTSSSSTEEEKRIAAIRLSPASEVPPQLSLFASQQDDERETALRPSQAGHVS